MNKEQKLEINELVKNINTKDKESLIKLYNIMYSEIFCFLKKYTFNKHEIEDVISQTFLCIMNKCQDKIIYKNCYSWILGISKYIYYNQYRKTQKEVLTDSIEDFLAPIDVKFDVHCTLESVVKKLSDFDQRLLYMKYYQNLTIYKISKILNVSVITVKRRHATLKTILLEKINNEENRK